MCRRCVMAVFFWKITCQCVQHVSFYAIASLFCKIHFIVLNIYAHVTNYYWYLGLTEKVLHSTISEQEAENQVIAAFLSQTLGLTPISWGKVFIWMANADLILFVLCGFCACQSSKGIFVSCNPVNQAGMIGLFFSWITHHFSTHARDNMNFKTFHYLWPEGSISNL